MKKLALTIPGFSGSVERVDGFPSLKPDLSAATLGSLLSQIFNLVLMIGAAVMLFWLFWGIFQYIFSGGKKESLAKARSRLIYAVVGFFLLALSLALQQFIQSIFPTTPQSGLTPISTPAPITP